MGLEDQIDTFCPLCSLHYCSRECKSRHSIRHKRQCQFYMINFWIKSLIEKFEKDQLLNHFLLQLAMEGFQQSYSGCLIFKFISPLSVKELLSNQEAVIDSPPTYFDRDELLGQNSVSRHLMFLQQSVNDYDPEQEFVVNFSVNMSDN